MIEIISHTSILDTEADAVLLPSCMYTKKEPCPTMSLLEQAVLSLPGFGDEYCKRVFTTGRVGNVVTFPVKYQEDNVLDVQWVFTGPVSYLRTSRPERTILGSVICSALSACIRYNVIRLAIDLDSFGYLRSFQDDDYEWLEDVILETFHGKHTDLVLYLPNENDDDNNITRDAELAECSNAFAAD